MIYKLFSIVAVLFALLAGSVAPAATQQLAAGTCLSANEARSAVQSGTVASLSSLRSKQPNLAEAEVVSAELCEQDGRYYYVVSVLLGGTVRTMTVEASD
jgi:uncharacterized membrane protein YkoI